MKFLTTNDFMALEPIDFIQKENEFIAPDSPIKNYHCLARAVYEYNGGRCVLKITADDFYRLYINGKYICQGPAPSYTDSYFFNEIDITDHLQAGKNVLAVHLYYQGLVNRVWVSGDNRFCLGAEINGTDLEWKYKVSKAYSGHINGYDTDFTESFDERLWQQDWCKLDFDDCDWQVMNEKNYDYTLSSQPTSLIDEYTLSPAKIEKTSYGYFVDIGREICGGVRLTRQAKSGDIVKMRYAEELDENGRAKYILRANCTYDEEWICKKGTSIFESFYYKGFRFLEIITDGELDKIEILCRHYPFDDNYCTPKFKNDDAEKIFNLCKSTIKYATQEGFIDCPTREKGQYLGDAFISAHSHILLTGKTDLAQKAVDDFAKSSKYCKGLLAVAPCSLSQEIADYSLLFGELLLTVYAFNNDIDFLKKYYLTAKNVLLHFKGFERDDGLLRQVSDKWNLVDWPENMRDDYDFTLSRPVVSDGVHNVINAYYIGAIITLNKIEELLGIEQSFNVQQLILSYRNAFKRDNLFADSEKSNHTSLHSNVLALYFGIADNEESQAIADFIIRKGFSCGVFFSYFVMKALARVGRKKELLSLLTNHSENGWINMINQGATTCFECWGKEQKHNTSLCHPWATAPVSIILEDLKEYVISENE